MALAVRDLAAGERAVSDIRASVAGIEVTLGVLDLADQASVRAFVAAWSGPLDILINHASTGVLSALERTAEGWEKQFATNFLGHFALTIGLHRALAGSEGARIVSVSSSASLTCPVIFDDLHFDFVPYIPNVAYGQSKTACILLAVEASRRWADDGIFANALYSGRVMTGPDLAPGGAQAPAHLYKTREQAAATSVLLAASPLLDGIGGRYFEDCAEARMVARRSSASDNGVAPYALDGENARRLWDIALELVS